MKFEKIILLIIAAVFLFSTVGFCDFAVSGDDGQHCVSCCGAGCGVTVLPSRQAVIIPSFSTFLISFSGAFRQEPFIGGIEYPPKNFI